MDLGLVVLGGGLFLLGLFWVIDLIALKKNNWKEY